MIIRCKVEEGGFKPYKAHKDDAGIDILSPMTIVVDAHSSTWVDTLVRFEIPKYHVGMIKSKSGLNMKGIQTEGVIDSGYTGTIRCKIYNHGDYGYTFCKGDKLTQLVILPIPDIELEYVDEIDGGERGEGGFGSTGK